MIGGWAKVELLGHISCSGFLNEVERFGAKLGEITFFNKDGSTGVRLFGPGAVYSITGLPSEEAAKQAAGVRPPAPSPQPAEPLSEDEVLQAALAAWDLSKVRRHEEWLANIDQGRQELQHLLRFHLGLDIPLERIQSTAVQGEPITIWAEVGGVKIERYHHGRESRPFALEGLPNHDFGSLAEFGQALRMLRSRMVAVSQPATCDSCGRGIDTTRPEGYFYDPFAPENASGYTCAPECAEVES